MNKEEPIIITVEPKFWDFFKPLFWIFFRRLWYVFIILFLVSLFSFKELFYGKTGSTNLLNFLPLFFLLLLIWSIYASAKKFVNSTEGGIVYGFSENEFDVTTSSSASQIKWSFFEKVKETKGDFLLFQNKARFHVIPKRFFQSEEQIKEIRELIREKMGVKAKLKND